MMKSHPDLARIFYRLNKRYFKSCLPRVLIYYDEIRVKKGYVCYGNVQRQPDNTFHIKIDPRRPSSMIDVEGTIIHECAHLLLYDITDTHGEAFQKVMLGLATRGAMKRIW